MRSKERRQLHDEIVDGSVKVEDISMMQITALKEGYMHDNNYEPSFEFFQMLRREEDRRDEVKKKKLNNFFR